MRSHNTCEAADIMSVVIDLVLPLNGDTGAFVRAASRTIASMVVTPAAAAAPPSQSQSQSHGGGGGRRDGISSASSSSSSSFSSSSPSLSSLRLSFPLFVKGLGEAGVARRGEVVVFRGDDDYRYDNDDNDDDDDDEDEDDTDDDKDNDRCP